jgi:crossover junction endodeoxyribonuclease RuvC
MGFGVIESDGDEIALVDCGALSPKRSSIGERLYFLYEELLKIIRRCRPDALAVETPFVGDNARSALAIGRAQAVAILAAASRKLPAFEYPPATIKQVVSGYGVSTKEQMQEIVKLQLGLEEVPQPHDAADALAVAICHLRQSHIDELLDRQDSSQNRHSPRKLARTSGRDGNPDTVIARPSRQSREAKQSHNF